MKTLYLFIADNKCRPETKFFFVPVGISEREQSQLKRLQMCAALSPHVYIKKHSQETSHFLEQVARQIWDGHRSTDVPRLFREYNLRKITPSNALRIANDLCNCLTKENLSYGTPKFRK